MSTSHVCEYMFVCLDNLFQSKHKLIISSYFLFNFFLK